MLLKHSSDVKVNENILASNFFFYFLFNFVYYRFVLILSRVELEVK